MFYYLWLVNCLVYKITTSLKRSAPLSQLPRSFSSLFLLSVRLRHHHHLHTLPNSCRLSPLPQVLPPRPKLCALSNSGAHDTTTATMPASLSFSTLLACRLVLPSLFCLVSSLSFPS